MMVSMASVCSPGSAWLKSCSPAVTFKVNAVFLWKGRRKEMGLNEPLSMVVNAGKLVSSNWPWWSMRVLRKATENDWFHCYKKNKTETLSPSGGLVKCRHSDMISLVFVSIICNQLERFTCIVIKGANIYMILYSTILLGQWFSICGSWPFWGSNDLFTAVI